MAEDTAFIEDVETATSRDDHPATIKLRFSLEHQCVWGLLEGEPGAGAIWIERKWNDTGRVESQIGRKPHIIVPGGKKSQSTYSGAERYSPNWYRVRACGHGWHPAESEFYGPEDPVIASAYPGLSNLVMTADSGPVACTDWF